MKTRLQIYIKKNTNYTLRTIATQHNVSIGEAVDILIENYKSGLNNDKLAEHIADVVCERMREIRSEEVE